MKKYLKYKQFWFALFFCVSLSIGCNSNPVNSSDSAWTQCRGLPNNLPVTGFARSGNNLFAGAYNPLLSQAYIYISDDGGSNWRLDTTFDTNNHDASSSGPITHFYVGTPITFLEDGVYLFAGIAAFTGNVYVSTDHGITWVERDTNFIENVHCFAVSGEAIFAGTGRGVFLSTNYGVSWNAANTGLPIPSNSGFAVSGIAVVGSDIFACTEGNGIYRSSNNGKSWIQVNTTNLDFYGGLATIGTYVFAGAFQFAGDTIGGVLVTTDNGGTWNARNVGLTNHMINKLYSYSSDLFSGNNEGVFRSTNYGESWIDISKRTSVDSTGAIALYVNGNFLFAGTNRNGAWRYPLYVLEYK